jgi:hypothetical protein
LLPFRHARAAADACLASGQTYVADSQFFGYRFSRASPPAAMTFLNVFAHADNVFFGLDDAWRSCHIDCEANRLADSIKRVSWQFTKLSFEPG